MLGYAMICHAALCYAMLCCAMLCYAMLCYAMVMLRGPRGGEPRGGDLGNRPGWFPLPGLFKHTSKNPLRQSLGREQTILLITNIQQCRDLKQACNYTRQRDEERLGLDTHTRVINKKKQLHSCGLSAPSPQKYECVIVSLSLRSLSP